jgi:formylglycine-generating enzyme required for sulfatase activity
MKNFTLLSIWILIFFLGFQEHSNADLERERGEQGEVDESHRLNLIHLPEEVLVQILKYLDLKELLGISVVNTTLHRLAHDNEVENSAKSAYLPQLGILGLSLPGGKFQMGSPEGELNRRPDEIQHKVTLSPFQVMDTHLTRGQAAALGIQPDFRGCNLSPDRINEWGQHPNRPLTCISWDDVEIKIIPAFKARGFQVRMMTEAEAEYLARLNGNEKTITDTPFPWGSDSSQLGDYAWWAFNSELAVHDVKTTQKTSADGLYDTRGNVYTWVKDWYGPYPRGADSNPKGPEIGTQRVIRGASAVIFYPKSFRSASRFQLKPQERNNQVSVRLVIESH